MEKKIHEDSDSLALKMLGAIETKMLILNNPPQDVYAAAKLCAKIAKEYASNNNELVLPSEDWIEAQGIYSDIIRVVIKRIVNLNIKK